MFRNSRESDGIDYNTEYYNTGTTFDNVGRRMNSSRESGYYDTRNTAGPQRRSNSGYYNQQSGNSAYYNQQSGNSEYYNQQRGNSGYYGGSASFNQRDIQESQRNERVEQLIYKSATLEGRYYNLDNPRNDMREFPSNSSTER